ncbi:proline racemase [Litchfieldella qijiaojingensis]|uniref:Proline racemase n=1 Tax=Litchfieldella qijiaojingensis TaxID=980347 RepID=A0ABQ2ZEC3_9GAMM|nr:proline racemase family protein [Halomonas qijiaojingensis]GGY11063.1 proline racemase [Halomonas qijiaojingensis]
MHWRKTLQLVDVHCEGEVGKVITGGVLDLPGSTMLDKMNYINEVDDSLRRFVTLEPRGCLQMSVNLLLPATTPDADSGLIILQSDKAHPMSGSNCICVVTALLELGMVRMEEPITTVTIDTPAGLISAQAHCSEGRCTSVKLDMVPAFVDSLDRVVEVPGVGSVNLDIAYGGVFYALVDAEQVGVEITPENAHKLAELGAAIKKVVNREIEVQHPVFDSIRGVAYVMFRNRLADKLYQTCTTLPPGRVDRSPCGTGSSANLATLLARGLVAKGDRLISRSIIGGEFQVEVRDIGDIEGRQAVLPSVTGRAWIYGFHQLGVDPDDPLADGFTLSDTWGRG